MKGAAITGEDAEFPFTKTPFASVHNQLLVCGFLLHGKIFAICMMILFLTLNNDKKLFKQTQQKP